MVLQLQHAKLSDIPAITRVQTEAFHTSSPIDRIMHPHGITPQVLKASGAYHERMFKEANTKYVIVTDSELTGDDRPDGAVIAFARWLVPSKEPQKKEAETAPIKDEAPMKDEDAKQSEDVNHEFMSRFFGNLTEMKRQHMGDRPCMCGSSFSPLSY